MTSILSLPSSTSSLLLLREDSLGKSCASASSGRSCGTVKYHRLDYTSTESISSRNSIQNNTLQRYHHIASLKSSSHVELANSNDPPQITDQSDTIPSNIGHSVSRSAPLTLTAIHHTRSPSSALDTLGTLKDETREWHIKKGEEVVTDVGGGSYSGYKPNDPTMGLNEQRSDTAKVPHAFRRWISRLRKRYQHPHQPAPTRARAQRWTLDDFDGPQLRSPARPHRSTHHKSDSQASSLGFVHAVKSATETLASTSIATISRRNGKWLSDKRRSSALSGSDPRASLDSQILSVDIIAQQRSYRRRQKLEELISSEEGYLADLKALLSAYSTILAHHPTRVSFVRIAAKKTLADLLHLHDDILAHLHQILPFAEYDKGTAKAIDSALCRTHTRWHSVDIVPPRQTRAQAMLATIRRGRRSLNLSRSSDEDGGFLQSSPQTIASVANVFAEQMYRFKTYEEYGVNYDLVQKDIDETQQSIPTWQEFDRAIEALSAHVSPARIKTANSKRAMTVKDLLIKPIQRLPRYELLFSDLRKLTPVCDDPEAYAKLTALLAQLNEACRRMNEVKDNPNRARMLQTTFLIGDRLTFSSQIPRSVFSQLLGHVQLCGCLYVAYRGKKNIKGCYMICVLFGSTLLLACDEEDGQQRLKYCTLAGINLATATIEETDNARGLQCHTAPHAWKVIFEHSARMFELVFVACSMTEADTWRKHISGGIQEQTHAVAAGTANVFELQSPLVAEMRSVGKAFGKPGSFVRRMSVHRTATVGPTTDINQVIIKNTQSVKEVQDSSSQQKLPIARSQSTGTPGHVHTLAPRRAERHRLETLLADVWTRELLPYPRMVRRSDPLRTSANNVIRKFSMASITSNFSSSKRSASYTSTRSLRKDEASSSKSRRPGSTSQSCKTSEPPTLPQLVDFHNAPQAFLPEDFELRDPPTTCEKAAIRASTLTTDCRSSQLPENENQGSGLRRTYSVCGGVKRVLTPASPVEQQAVQRPRTPGHSAVAGQNPTPAPYSAYNPSDGATAKSPKKSKSMHRLFRLFATDHH